MSRDAGINMPLELSLLGLLALLWGSTYLFMKVAVGDIPPVTLIASRVLIAAVLLLGVMYVRREHLPRNIEKWRMLLTQALLNAIIPWILLAWGMQYIDASLGSVLNSTSPIFVFLITFFYTRHEPTSALKLAGTVLGLAGVLMIVGVDALDGLGQQVAGQLAALGGAVLYGGAAIYGKRFKGQSATITAAGTMICASVVLVPLALVIDQPWQLRPSPQALMAALALGVLSTGFALLIYFRLVKTLGSLGVASQAFLRSGFGVLLGVTLLGEIITPIVGFGLFVSILGVALINFPVKQLASKDHNK